MKLTHNLRRISRNLNKLPSTKFFGSLILARFGSHKRTEDRGVPARNRNSENIIKGVAVLMVSIIFSIGLLFADIGDFLRNNGSHVLGSKSRQDIDIQGLVNQTALDISNKNFREANKHLSIVLEFDPSNVYALEMNRKLDSQVREIEVEILRTLKIVELQPNWKEAWLKLADLYEKVGKSELAEEARERAKGLKTS